MLSNHKYLFKIRSLIISLLLLGSYSQVYSVSPEVPDDLKVFLDKFSDAVLSHESTQVMSLMDADYKKEQHDAFLKGNTQEFLDKFFCGYDPVDGETYECMKLGEITKLELTTVMPDTGLYIVLFNVTDGDSTVEVTWIVSAIPEDDTTKFGMIGAYG